MLTARIRDHTSWQLGRLFVLNEVWSIFLQTRPKGKRPGSIYEGANGACDREKGEIALHRRPMSMIAEHRETTRRPKRPSCRFTGPQRSFFDFSGEIL
ncbi:MAG: hypothetical protein A4E47_01355 [Methanosaeta sp. PtaU1.Bin028]|nr:MAG: hypothetical protein A4E47_01355 [Methanosaeta sp. PtaU1.Bin028]